MHKFTVLLALLLSLGCTSKRYRMPSGSMIPSIDIGETVSADTTQKTPTRGEVFVFDYPENPASAFVKRVIGVGGERIETKGRRVLINGTALPSCEVGPYTKSIAGEPPMSGTLVLEGTPPYLTFYAGEISAMDGHWEVKPGEYFMMGDNRNNSHDSRQWFAGAGGSVAKAALHGRIALPKVALPKDASDPLLQTAFTKCLKELSP